MCKANISILLTYLVSTVDVLVPNLAEEFRPPLESLCGKVDVCKSVGGM